MFQPQNKRDHLMTGAQGVENYTIILSQLAETKG
jgi:hypothetical protein